MNEKTMRKVINKGELRRIIAESVSEALKYDKYRRQYFPNYTGNKHSDAGKYTGDYKDDFNYTRNDYKWRNQKNQDRFNSLQWQRDLEIDPSNPDRENEAGAEEYLGQRSADTLVQKAIDEMSPKFNDLIQKFCDNAEKKHPILKNRFCMMDFVDALKNVVEDF